MAEVKTYKCDICGKVYHLDMNDCGFITIHHKECIDDSVSELDYDHICPTCAGEIVKVINEPDILKQAMERYEEVDRDCKDFAEFLRNIYNKMCSYIVPNPWGRVKAEDCEYMFNKILDKYSYYKDQEYKCFEYKADCARKDKILRWTAAICGGVIGCLIAVIIHLV